MKAVLTIMLFFISVFLAGCPSENIKTNQAMLTSASTKKPFDAMPAEGWATDPIFSYNLYSYYPMDFKNGGYYQPYLHPFSRMQ